MAKSVPASLGEHPRLVPIVAVASLSSLMSGFINGVYLIQAQTFVSSVNGLLSLVARDYVALGNYVRGSLLLAQIATFFVGCVLAGLFYDQPLRHRARYALGFMAVSCVIFLGTGLFAVGSNDARIASLFVVALACGFQNGMCSFFSKGVLRTTHQTGAVTDLGLLMGQWLQIKWRGSEEGGKRPDYWKIKVILPVAATYFAGGFCGVAAIAYGSYLWMLLPSGLLFVVSLAYVVWQRVLKCRKVKQQSTLLQTTEEQFESTTVELK